MVVTTTTQPERHDLTSCFVDEAMDQLHLQSALPSKPCVACGRPMSWRRRWARTWSEVKYCSDACRRAKTPGG